MRSNHLLSSRFCKIVTTTLLFFSIQNLRAEEEGRLIFSSDDLSQPVSNDPSTLELNDTQPVEPRLPDSDSGFIPQTYGNPQYVEEPIYSVDSNPLPNSGNEKPKNPAPALRRPRFPHRNYTPHRPRFTKPLTPNGSGGGSPSSPQVNPRPQPRPNL